MLHIWVCKYIDTTCSVHIEILFLPYTVFVVFSFIEFSKFFHYVIFTTPRKGCMPQQSLRMSEDSLWASVFSLHHVGPRDWTQGASWAILLPLLFISNVSLPSLLYFPYFLSFHCYILNNLLFLVHQLFPQLPFIFGQIHLLNSVLILDS